MKELHADKIVAEVSRLLIDSNINIGSDVTDKLNTSMKTEDSEQGRDIISQLIENASIARQTRVPICQDTGLAVIFLELGQDVHIAGGDLTAAVNEGVRRGCREGYLRASVVRSPVISRVNTGDNTPAIIHTTIVPGDRLRIVVAPKGGGSENMSALRMLKPADGVEGVKRFVVDTVELSGANACPPLVVGVGVGGNFEHCALLAKRALLRPLGDRNPDPGIARLEEDIAGEIGRLGIGPAGLGGSTTALAVHVETHPCHIASLPVAVNLNCHAHRHAEVVL